MKIIELIQFTYDDFYDMHFKTYDLKDKIVFKIGTMSE